MFGFHLASIDLRQSSDIHEAVIAELLRHAGVEDDYAALPEADKVSLLLAELAQPRPQAFGPFSSTPRSPEVELGVLETARVTREKFGWRAVRNTIISHTETVSDPAGSDVAAEGRRAFCTGAWAMSSIPPRTA